MIPRCRQRNVIKWQRCLSTLEKYIKIHLTATTKYVIYLPPHLKLHCFCKLWARGQGVTTDSIGREADSEACHPVLLWMCCAADRDSGVQMLASLDYLALICFYLITNTIHKH